MVGSRKRGVDDWSLCQITSVFPAWRGKGKDLLIFSSDYRARDIRQRPSKRIRYYIR
jgi:hypothetical protein